MTGIRRIISFMVLLGILVPFSVYAQSSTSIRINYTEVTEEPDSLALGVYFTLIDDSTGYPITNAQIQSAEMILLDTQTSAIAKVKKADTPFYIVLVLDASGSMQSASKELREAATEALNEAPKGARFAVVRFNDKIDVLQDFTDDKDRLTRAIDQVVPVYNAGTCLYDATYQAIEMLGQTPPGRRTIVLFTDGKDETLNKTFCSQHTYDDDVTLANQPAMHVPINTIGLSGKAQNINASELNNMASTTGGFSVIGTQGNIKTLFKQIMDALNSQWLATANLYPTKGQHEAVVRIIMKDASSISTTVKFTSSRDYVIPPEPVSLAIDGFEFNPDTKIYTLNLRFVSPQLVKTLKVQVWEDKGGTQVSEYTLSNLTSLQTIDIKTQDLQAGETYQLHILVFGPDDQPIKDADGKPIEIVHKFSYNPAVIKTTLAISSVVLQEKQLLVKLQVVGKVQVATYKGWLVDEDTKSEVAGTTFTLAASSVADSVPIPLENIRGGKYTVKIQALDKDNNVLAEAEYQGVVYSPPKPPSKLSVVIGRLVSGLKANPWIIITIVAIICLIIIGLIAIAFLARRETGAPVLQGKIETVLGSEQQISPVNLTRVDARPVQVPSKAAQRPAPVAAPAPAMPLAVIKIKQTPSPAEQGRTLRVTPVPFVIGREDCDLSLPDDRKVSRRHAKITYDSNTSAYYITDLGSVNGVWVDGNRIPANQAVRLTSGKTIGLGPDTILVFGMQG